jgi:hypothetical protein
MKPLFYKSLSIVIAIFALTAFAWRASAQRFTEKTVPVADFTGIVVSGDFNVYLSNGPQKVKVGVTKSAFIDYVSVYVRSKVLYVEFKEKDVPKDLKKELKAKDLVFRVEISSRDLNDILLKDNAVLESSEALSISDFKLSLENKAQIKEMNVRADKASVSLKDKSQAKIGLNVDNKLSLYAEDSAELTASVTCSNLEVKCLGSSKLTLDGDVYEEAVLNPDGSSKLTTTIDTETLTLNATGRSNITLKGAATSLVVKGDKNFNAEASELKVPAMEAVMTGGSINVAVQEMDVDLIGGSEVTYSGDPKIVVRRVVKSTLAPVTADKKK